ncbi:MAG: Uma2 family endonuclease [Chloroflexia bacterium]|nr:Uma2 family endonuclease [Chloroflexia bacterium]
MTATVAMSAVDLLRLPDEERPELVEGVPWPMSPTNWKHLRTVNRMTVPLSIHAERNNLGVVGGEGGFVFGHDPDTILAPDIVFVRMDRLPPADQEGFIHVVPDLVVEVMSPSDTAERLDEKVQRYLAAGVRLVWVANPLLRSVTEYTPDRTARIFVEGETLSGGDVIPGFELPVADIFAWP